MSEPVTRRRFVQAAAGATAAVAPARRASGRAAPSERVRIGLIGCGGRGRQLLQVMRQFLMTFNYRGFNNFRTVQNRPFNHGICFHGNQATMVLDRSGFEIWEDRRMDQSVQRVDNPRHWGDGKPGNEVDGPWQRLFVDCVKSGTQPPIDLEESHRATVCCHLANIAYRVGRSITWDGESETIAGDAQASALLSRPRRAGYELPEV